VGLLASCDTGTVVVAAALVLQPLAAYGAAIAPALAQVPLQGVNPVKPNLMFTLDDSGSMAFEFVPDYVGNYTSAAATGNHYFCLNQNDFPTALATGRLCGQLSGTWGGNSTAAPGISDPRCGANPFNQVLRPCLNFIAVNELRNALDYETPATAGTWTVYSDGLKTTFLRAFTPRQGQSDQCLSGYGLVLAANPGLRLKCDGGSRHWPVCWRTVTPILAM
jgi:hypothetical protein